MKLNFPALPNFRLTEEEIAQALDAPVTEKYRFGEITIQPEGERPRLSNRLLVHAYKLYMTDKPQEFATLMKGLFLLWATGKLVILEEGTTVIVNKPQTDQNQESINLDFDLSDLTVDMTLNLPDEYSLGGLE